MSADYQQETDVIRLDRLTPEAFAAALHHIAGKLRHQATEIEGLLALWAGVPYGHPEAANEESRILREAAAAVDVTLKRFCPQFCPKKAAGDDLSRVLCAVLAEGKTLTMDKTTQN
jgi:hypothetical protein